MMSSDHAPRGEKEEDLIAGVEVKNPAGILFATDFSGASSPAFREAIRLAAGRGAPLFIAHVLRIAAPLSPDGFPFPRTADELAAAARREAGRAIASLLKTAGRARVRATGLLLTGNPERAIARAAKKHGVDLVVVGTHGRSGLPRLILGSVAARVIAAAPCPVLAVPQRRGARGSRWTERITHRFAAGREADVGRARDQVRRSAP